MKTFKEKLNEGILEDDLVVYEIKVRDEEQNLLKLLEAIKSLGNIGHSFEIIIDPKSEHEEKFYWDGDGCDLI